MQIKLLFISTENLNEVEEVMPQTKTDAMHLDYLTKKDTTDENKVRRVSIDKRCVNSVCSSCSSGSLSFQGESSLLDSATLEHLHNSN